MNIIVFTLALGAGSIAAGFLGALTGLGGGVVIVPLLVLLFGVDIRYAIGASLVSVIATSSGAAAAYVREGYSNIRVGMFLEIATTVGALSGASDRDAVPTSGAGDRVRWCCWSRRTSQRQPERRPRTLAPDRWPRALRLDSHLPDRWQAAGLPRAARAHRLRPHVCGGRAFRSARASALAR